MTAAGRALLAAMLLAGVAAARPATAALEVRAELSPDPLGRDETATFTIEVAVDGSDLPEVEPGFLLDNFDLLRGPMRSLSHSWVNGESSSRLQLAWELQPRGLGRARVHGIRVTAGKEVRALPDAAVEVVATPPAGRGGARAAPADPFSAFFDEDPLSPFRRRGRPATPPEVLLRSSVDRSVAWVGEQIVWRLLLDTQTDISGFQPRDVPDFAGFWARELPRAGNPRPERVEDGGKTYFRVPMLERALFPLRAGKLRLEGVSAVVVARVADADWFGRLAQDEPLRRASNPLDLEVRALPAPAPLGFGGVVGALDLQARLEATQIAAGGATNLVLTARSDGNLRGVGAPALALPAGLRSFPPATETSEKIVGGRLETTVTWRYVVLADAAGSFLLPPVTLPYFEPAAGLYREAASPALALAVTPRAEVAAPPAAAGSVAAPPTPPAPADRRPARARLWALVPAILAAALLAALLLLARRWRRAHPAARELREALGRARAEPSPRSAAGVIEEGWRRYLEARYSLGRGVPVAQWSSALGARGVGAADATELAALFEEIHLLAWAPELADAEALRRDLFERSRRLARRLR